MNWLGFISRHYGLIAIAAALILGKNSCNHKAEAERHKSNYEAIQQTTGSTARRLNLTVEQLTAENKRLLDSLNIKSGKVQFVYRTKWRTETDTFEVEVERWHIDLIPCPIQTFTVDTNCIKLTALLNPDSAAKVTLTTNYDLSVVGYWQRPGKWFGAKLWNGLLGKKEAYIKIASPCFKDSAVYLNKFSQAQ